MIKTVLPYPEAQILLSNLIAAKSGNPPGNEIEAAKVLGFFFDGKSIPWRLEYVEENRPNIIAELKGQCGQTEILLTSHLDVVPEGELYTWQTDPFQAEIKDGKLYGRGACDAKGSLASMAVAFATLAQDRNNLRGDLTFAGVMGEETGSSGSKALVNSGIKAEAVIIGEPTRLEVCIAHKGRMQIDVEIIGKASHASQSDKGINAVLEMGRLIGRIDRFQKKIKQRSSSLVGNASLTITCITGGGKHNCVPEKCVLQLDRRLIPEENSEFAKEEFQKLIAGFSQTSKARIKAEYQITTQSYAGSARRPLVKAAMEAISAVKGLKTKPKGFEAGCDMYIFGQERGCSVIVLGPGNIELAHAANEYIDLVSLNNAVRIYIKTIEQLWRDK